MPEVRATSEFYDMAAKSVRHVGSEFFCDEERAHRLASYGMVEVIGIPAWEAEKEPEPEPAPEAPKRKRKKKAE